MEDWERVSGPSTWERFSPFDVHEDPILEEVLAHLDRDETVAEMEAAEASGTYPRALLKKLWDMGVAAYFAEPEGRNPYPTRITPPHVYSLNAALARRWGSLAVTVGVNGLALLPAYIAANPTQREAIFAHVREGALSSMLLTEKEHGSNLLRNQARAEAGRLLPDGTFQPSSGEEEVTHYRLSGQKDLINGGGEHELLFAFLRTRPRPTEGLSSLKARADFSFFWVPRGPTVRHVKRWKTLPVPAADISSLAFEDTVVGRDHLLGEEGEGFSIGQRALRVSRGGIASLASGTSTRARNLAFRYARHRRIYDDPILHLGAIAEHLMRLDALDRLANAITMKASAMANAHGLGAAIYTACAKRVACLLGEEAVTEGRAVMGGRALLRSLPFVRFLRDAPLFGIFDGTSHVMLEELQYRLYREVRRPSAVAAEDAAQTLYGTEPTGAVEKLGDRVPPLYWNFSAHIRHLADLPGLVDLLPLADLYDGLAAFLMGLHKSRRWRDEQRLRFEVADIWTGLEAMAALAELFDPERRAALGIRSLEARPHDGPGFRYAWGWFGGRLTARLRSLVLAEEELGDWAPEGFAGFDELERAFRAVLGPARSDWRTALEAWGADA